MDLKLLKVIILGFGFMFLLTAFQTMGNIEKILLDSIQTDDPSFTGDGYTSLAIIYTVFALCNWLAPSFLSYSGPRGAMVVGSVTYCLFMVQFLWPKTWLLYLASVILGIGASIIWTGQGTYLARCSDLTTISRNSGIFWAMLQTSMLFGNLFVYYQFQENHIKKDSRNLVILVLLIVAIIGVILLASLRPQEDNSNDGRDNEQQSGLTSAIIAFKSSWKLFLTRDMLLLSVTFTYTGIELSFFSGVYGSSIGFTSKISDKPKQIVGLAGICIGIGEVLGGCLFGILGNKTAHFGRNPIVIAGLIVHVITFVLVFINLPNNAPFKDTNDISYLHPPRAWLALLCAFSLGLGDACFNTQIFSMLGGEFVRNSAGAFALFNFFKSGAAACCFFYSSHLGLKIQLGILFVLATLGTMTFGFVEWSIKKKRSQQENDAKT